MDKWENVPNFILMTKKWWITSSDNHFEISQKASMFAGPLDLTGFVKKSAFVLSLDVILERHDSVR